MTNRKLFLSYREADAQAVASLKPLLGRDSRPADRERRESFEDSITLLFVGEGGLTERQRREADLAASSCRSRVVLVVLPGAVDSDLRDATEHLVVDLRSARSMTSRIKRLAAFTQDVAGGARLTNEFVGDSLQFAGEFEEAGRAYSRAIGVCAGATDSRRPDVSALRRKLGKALHAGGRSDAARAEFERALISESPMLGDGRWALIESAILLAGVHRASGRLSDADSLLRQSLAELQESADPACRILVASAMHELGVVLQTKGDLTGARQTLERSLEEWLRLVGSAPHPSTAVSQHALASVLQDQGDLVGARALLEVCVASKQAIYGDGGHPSVAASLNNLASVMRAQGDIIGATDLTRRAIEMLRDCLGTDVHPAVAAAMHNMAELRIEIGDLEGADACLSRVMDVKRLLYGDSPSLSLAVTMQLVAEVRRRRGGLDEARAILHKALAMARAFVGDAAHPSLSIILHNIAVVEAESGRYVEAVDVLEEACRIELGAFGSEDHYIKAETELQLSTLLAKVGRADEAREAFGRAVSVIRAQRPDHPILQRLAGVAGQVFYAGDSARGLPTKVLFVGANPCDASPQIADEYRQLEGVARPLGQRLRLLRHGPSDAGALADRIQAEMPHVVHFVGHGDLSGVASDSPGLDHGRLPHEVVEQCFSSYGVRVRLVVLMACYSDSQARAMIRSVDCVVGMRYGVKNDSMRAFCSAFYRDIAMGASVAAAYGSGRDACRMMVADNRDMPRLLVRHGVLAHRVSLSHHSEAPHNLLLSWDEAWAVGLPRGASPGSGSDMGVWHVMDPGRARRESRRTIGGLRFQALPNGSLISETMVSRERFQWFASEQAVDVSISGSTFAEVTWEGALAFCRWIGDSVAPRMCLRLPTESEWEWACINSVRLSGDGDVTRGWLYGESLRDGLAGNVWEWCIDSNGTFGGEVIPGGEAASGIARVVSRVLRGGAFCRLTDPHPLSDKARRHGFRVVIAQNSRDSPGE